MSSYKSPIKYILSDFDGTLMDAHPFYLAMRTELIQSAGGNPKAMNEELHMAPEISLMDLQAIVARHYGCPENPEKVNGLFEDLIHSQFHQCQAIPGALKLVNDLTDLGATVVICSNSPGRSLVHGHKQLVSLNGGVDPFDFIISACDVSNPKPAPDMYLLAMKQLGARPEECMVLEDSRTGMKAGLAAGAGVLLLTERVDLSKGLDCGVTPVASWDKVSARKILNGDYAHPSRNARDGR